MPVNNKKLIVVLGMHRSGTSAITRGIVALGASVGENLVPEGADNPTGFWEDMEFVQINDRLLEAIGQTYESLALMPTSYARDERVNVLRDEATALMSGKLTRSPVWVLKDPRVSRLLPFWKPVFAQLGVEVAYVVAVRHPFSVADSLEKRNEFPRQKSLLLWLEHYVACVTATQSDWRVFVDYDLLLENPRLETERIAKVLELEQSDHGVARVNSFISEFLSGDLRHTRYVFDDLRDSRELPPDLTASYRLLLAAARDEVAPNDPTFMKKWDDVAERLAAFASVLDLLGQRDHAAIIGSVIQHELTSQISQLQDQASRELDDARQALMKVESEKDSVSRRLEVVEAEFYRTVNSRSWRLTQPLRTASAVLRNPQFRVLRMMAANPARILWRHVPLSVGKKQRLEHMLFSNLPWLFGWTQAYRAWRGGTGKWQDAEASRHPVCSNEDRYVPLLEGRPIGSKPAKLICFYLPQFHAIPENDAWWGEGFTEWTNVRPAAPQFEGHYQPHMPGELGYYNLLDGGVQARQVELAKLYGIGGFCFYFYWFGGKRLLEAPIERYLNDASLDLPFCLCWANENWSRRWDGLDSEILIAQEHSQADDLAFIRHVSRYMKDDRYIRVNGKPLLIVYRPSLLPAAKETADRWRSWCRDEGIGEIYLAYTQSFETVDPAKYGFDAAIEFPPNNSAPPNITSHVKPLQQDFGSTVYDWRVFVERSENYKEPSYRLFRSVCPSWDNTARRKNRGTVFINNSPELYRRWLENAIGQTNRQFRDADEKLIFVNAWNEWAEGAHLEPDEEFGYAWLQATRDALLSTKSFKSGEKIVLVSHDAHPHGAQYLVLHLARALSMEFGFAVEIVLLESGVLVEEMRRYGTVHDLAGADPNGKVAHELARKLMEGGCDAAIVNTTVSGLFLKTLSGVGIKCVALIHELRGVIEANKLENAARAIAMHADRVIFPAKQVADSFAAVAEIPADHVKIRPQGLYKRNAFRGNVARARELLRNELGLGSDDQIVLGVGYADQRKGIDLFVESGLRVIRTNPHAHFVWVGHWDAEMQGALLQRVTDENQERRFHFVGRKTDTDMFYAGSDLYALTSREDPFPSVVMESLEVGVPVVGFKDAGGFENLLRDGCGLLVPKEDVAEFSNAVSGLLDDPVGSKALGDAGAALIQERFSFRHYIFDLLEWAGKPLKRISAVVPNFNYAHHLKQRLNSIADQSYPMYEIVVIDDASTDDSLTVIRAWLADCEIDQNLIVNDTNSGSVFKQWRKAADVARGEYVWICEADDFADPEFVSRAVELFDDTEVVMAYTQSRQIGELGQRLAENYLEYTDEISVHKWRHDYVNDGSNELAAALAIKNTIPNVSGVVFRRDPLRSVLERCSDELSRLRIAGDWLVYAELLREGKVGYVSESLNSHRRHEQSVTISSSSAASHFAEIIFMQERVAELVEVDEKARITAAEYVRKVYSQFELDPVYALNPAVHPDIKVALQAFSGNRPDDTSSMRKSRSAG